MTDENEKARHVLPWRRHKRPDEPDQPTPDEPRPVSRRHVGRHVFDFLRGWFALATELPVALRLLLWGVVVLLAAIIFRTLRGARR